jgi:hypothetical protein
VLATGAAAGGVTPAELGLWDERPARDLHLAARAASAGAPWGWGWFCHVACGAAVRPAGPLRWRS